jgi:phosphoglycerate kinase
MADYLEEIQRKNFFVSNHLGELNNKKILLRIDTNSAVINGKLDLNSYKVFAHSQTLKKYVDEGAIPIIITHQGRKGDEEFIPNLEPIARKIEELSGVKINYVNEIMGENVEKAINELKPGEALMLKNIRDHTHETDLESIDEMTNSPLTKFLREQADIFINDSFSVCHRRHLSVVALAQVMPSYYGLLLESELKILQPLIDDLNNGKEVTFFVGGKKFEKLNYLEKILEYPGVKFSTGGLIGQYIAYADGLEFNEENIKLLKDTEIEKAKSLLNKFEEKITYPVDFVLDDGSVVTRDQLCSSKGVVMDIGPETLNLYSKNMNGKCVFAGVMGVFEKGFCNTLELLRVAAGPNAINLGGHSSAVLFQNHGIYTYFTKKGGRVLTAGGAALALLAGEKMPGLEVCLDKEH